MRIRQSMAADLDALLDVWLRSVRATHTFLTEADIQELLPDVRDYLSRSVSDLWTLCSETSEPIGFMGLTDSSIVALFVAPEHMRRGGGRLLLKHARSRRGLLRVDVNEQNPEAIKFYEASGFEVVGRSPRDGKGRPFPLLHMCATRR
jgi:putative acetyltransferase